MCGCDKDNKDNKDNKEEEVMATPVMSNFYSINEFEAKLIANTPKTTIKTPSYVNKFHLSPEQREQRALETLRKWK